MTDQLKFVGTGLSMHTGSVRFKAGEFRPIGPGMRIANPLPTSRFKKNDRGQWVEVDIVEPSKE